MMRKTTLGIFCVWVSALLIGACAPWVRERAPESPSVITPIPEAFPGRQYEQAAAQGKPIYRIDPARSLITIHVGRGGSLAHLGHEHVVTSRAVQGDIAPEEGRADLYVRLADLSVDEPALRAEAGLSTQPSEADIAATHTNMHDKVLQTQQFPFALVHINGLKKTSGEGEQVTAAITLRGVTRSFEVPVQWAADAREMRITGQLAFNQSDFGIVPFSVLGGALQVQDRLNLRFRIHAIRRGLRPEESRPNEAM